MKKLILIPLTLLTISLTNIFADTEKTTNPQPINQDEIMQERAMDIIQVNTQDTVDQIRQESAADTAQKAAEESSTVIELIEIIEEE